MAVLGGDYTCVARMSSHIRPWWWGRRRPLKPWCIWSIWRDFQHKTKRHKYNNPLQFHFVQFFCRSQWPGGLRCRSEAAHLLGSWVGIPPVAWIYVWCKCWVLSGRGPCDELITCPEDSCRLWRVVLCDLDFSWMRRPWPPGGLSRQNKKTNFLGRYLRPYRCCEGSCCLKF